jgi:hypothetical protein
MFYFIKYKINDYNDNNKKEAKTRSCFHDLFYAHILLVEHLAVLLLKNSLKIIYAEISVAFTSHTDN